jgi:diaminopimelate decarboxylase
VRAEPPATFKDYGRVVGQVLSKAFPDSATAPTLFLEPGTALVADVMTFYTQVVSTKSVRDRHFATVSGSIFDISPNAKTKSLPVTPILDPKMPRGVVRDFVIAGFTCIEGDVLTDSLIAPLRAGDVLAYGNVGSYSIVMRPSFILPSNPILMVRENEEGFDVIKARQSNEAVFDLFKEIGT